MTYTCAAPPVPVSRVSSDMQILYECNSSFRVHLCMDGQSTVFRTAEILMGLKYGAEVRIFGYVFADIEQYGTQFYLGIK